MSYYVKKCRSCGTVNHPNNALCQQCGGDLPLTKIESDQPPPPPVGPAVSPATETRPTVQRSRPIDADPQPALGASAQPAEVRIVDIRMPFLSMVVFMVKWALAAIPALLILVITGALLSGFLAGLVHSKASTSAAAARSEPAIEQPTTDELAIAAADACEDFLLDRAGASGGEINISPIGNAVPEIGNTWSAMVMASAGSFSKVITCKLAYDNGRWTVTGTSVN